MPGLARLSGFLLRLILSLIGVVVFIKFSPEERSSSLAALYMQLVLMAPAVGFKYILMAVFTRKKRGYISIKHEPFNYAASM